MSKPLKNKSKKMPEEILTGPISINSKGVGFFDIADTEESLEIQPQNLSRAFHGDIVEVERLPQKIRGRVQAKVRKIISRAKNEYVGTVARHGGKTVAIPDDKRMYADIILPTAEDAKIPENTKVLIGINWEQSTTNLTGDVIEIIGVAGENNTEMNAIVLEKGFRVAFPLDVEAEAEEIKQSYLERMPEEITKRRDMRGITTMTIDPRDAKDFDDAISYQKLPDGTFEIGVHIADVSYFVTPGTALDREAEKRGLSVYLVDRTIPMLPEVLSNDLCSLNPEEDKYTFSAIFKMKDSGEILEEWFGRTVIHSDRRFTYEDAQEVIDGKQPGPFQDELRTLNTLAKTLEKKKFHGGAINFETEEVKFELDEKGKPIRVYKKQRLETHKLVEEYMLLANRAVAKNIFFAQNKEARKGAESVYRIHESPNPERIEELAIFVKALGFNLRNKEGQVTSQDINALLKEIEGTPNEELIKTATIRSMAKAVYSTKNIGHFGLAFQYYTHFTSPIRRYPDLLVHRFLERELIGGKVEQDEYAKFERICMASSDLEKKAADAERASIKYKQVEYMQDHVGETFDGTITGVTEWGIYIEEKETRCEGMVKIRDIGGDFYSLDEKNYTLKGEKTGKKYTLGDTVTFKVVSADMEKRVLDYALV